MLVAMSRIIWKPDFARMKSVSLSNAAQIRKCWICLPLLSLAIPLCPSPSLALQTDRSVLVIQGSESSAGSNAQVELETELPHAIGSTPSLELPATTQQFLPPSPPASMSIESEPEVKPLRPVRDEYASVQATTVTLPTTDSGTFTSRLPSDAESASDSNLQTDNSFGSSRAPSSFRSDPTNGSTRNRFGDFGAAPTPKVANRFAPLNSNQSSSASQPQSASNRPTSPAVIPASAEQPIKSNAGSNRFSSPASTGQRFSQPSSSKSAPTLLPASQPITNRSISTPPSSPRQPIQPQANSKSFGNTSTSSPQTSSRFPAAPSKFANTASSNSRQSSSFGDSGLRPTNNSGSRTVLDRNTGTESARSSTPMIQRQPSSSPSSFSNSSGPSQSNTGSSRLPQQSSRFASRSGQQPLRGQSADSGNTLRNNPSNNQAPLARQSSTRNQSNGKADRDSINFARQQIINIQPTSVDANGTPVRLQEMLLEPLSGSQRKQMVAQYWETYYDLAALKITSDYRDWLDSISASGVEQGLLNAAQQMASDQQLAAKIQLGKSQSRLLDFMPNPRPNEFAPLPADQPLVEHYVTDYEKYKRVRSLPTSLRGIDPMLASTLKLITQRAKTASTAKNAADQAGRSVRTKQVSLASAIAAGDLWRDAQLDMVASTVSYNQAISDFVLTLEPNRSPEQLTAFMLGAPKNDLQSGAANSRSQNTRSAANQQGFPSNRQQFR